MPDIQQNQYETHLTVSNKSSVSEMSEQQEPYAMQSSVAWMHNIERDQYAAPQQALGYFYQVHLALLKLFEAPVDSSLFVERSADIELMSLSNSSNVTLIEVKHKKEGGALTDLSLDFWKCIRIWLKRFQDKQTKNYHFILCTTEDISSTSFLNHFLKQQRDRDIDIDELLKGMLFKESKNTDIKEIREEFKALTLEEQKDFLTCIDIFKECRISEIPSQIKDKHLQQACRKKDCQAIFSKIDKWFYDEVVNMLDGRRVEPISKMELREKLADIRDEYTFDNLPQDFADEMIEPQKLDKYDGALFVKKMQEIDLSNNRIMFAKQDYYRASKQRSSWLREGRVSPLDSESYDKKLFDEWERSKERLFEELEADLDERSKKNAGKGLFNWAQDESLKREDLRIRPKVSEAYVIRGSFHILANDKLYWHPSYHFRDEKWEGNSE